MKCSQETESECWHNNPYSKHLQEIVDFFRILLMISHTHFKKSLRAKYSASARTYRDTFSIRVGMCLLFAIQQREENQITETMSQGSNKKHDKIKKRADYYSALRVIAWWEVKNEWLRIIVQFELLYKVKQSQCPLRIAWKFEWFLYQ